MSDPADILAGLDLPDETKLAYGMLADCTRSLGLLHAKGFWKDDPSEMLTLDESKSMAFAKCDSNARLVFRYEKMLWPSTRLLMQAVYDAGGKWFTMRDIIGAAKMHSLRGDSYRNNRKQKLTPEESEERRRKYLEKRRKQSAKWREKYQKGKQQEKKTA